VTRYKLPLFLYYALAFLLPLSFAVVFSFQYSQEVLGSIAMPLFRFTSILYVLPIAIVYSFVAAQGYFPDKPAAAWSALAGVAVPTGATLLFSRQLAATIAMQGTVFLGGFCLVLVVGLFVLVWQRRHDAKDMRDALARIAVLMALVVPFFLVLAFYVLTGWHYMALHPVHPNLLTSNLFFVLQLSIVFVQYWPKMIVLYKRGAL